MNGNHLFIDGVDGLDNLLRLTVSYIVGKVWLGFGYVPYNGNAKSFGYAAIAVMATIAAVAFAVINALWTLVTQAMCWPSC